MGEKKQANPDFRILSPRINTNGASHVVIFSENKKRCETGDGYALSKISFEPFPEPFPETFLEVQNASAYATGRFGGGGISDVQRVQKTTLVVTMFAHVSPKRQLLQ